MPARVLFIGEAPGQEEDLQGLPFVGKSGQLLRKMIKFLGFESFYITNLVKCHPPDNRNPTPDEITACMRFMDHQFFEINPKVVVTVGKFASQALLSTETSISDLRGNIYKLGRALVIPAFHPAYILRNPKMTEVLLDDLRKARILEEKLK